MWYKKIKHGLDLLGNKIKGAKVENPTDNEHIANKLYVDTSTTLDTPRAKSKVHSTKFSWVTDVADKSIKTVLEKLLFPVVNPEYKNPVLTSFSIINTGGTNNTYGSSISGTIDFHFTKNDRNHSGDAYLKVNFLNGNSLNFEGTDEINFSFIFSDVKSIEFVQVFSPAIWRNNSEGEEYIDSRFNTPFEFKKVIPLTDFLNIFNIKYGVYWKKVVSYDEGKNLTGPQVKSTFTFSNNINLHSQAQVDVTERNKFVIFIPKEYETGVFLCSFTETATGKKLGSQITSFQKNIIEDSETEINGKRYIGIGVFLGFYLKPTNLTLSY